MKSSEIEAPQAAACEYCGLTGEHRTGCPATTGVVCVKTGCAGCSFKGTCKHEF